MVRSADEVRQDFMRAEILRVAERMFAENGIKHTTMGQLAEAMQLTRPALYHYFASKQQIVEHTIRAAIGKYWIFDVVDDATSISDAAGILIERRARQVAEAGPTDLRFFYTAIIEQIGSPDSDQSMKVILDAHRDSLRRVLRGAVERGELASQFACEQLVTEVTARIIGVDLLWLVEPNAMAYKTEMSMIGDRLRRCTGVDEGNPPESNISGH